MDTINTNYVKEVDFNKYNTNYVKDIDFSKYKPKRAGVIIYTVYKNKMYFILGKDHKSGNITDFGGGISAKCETGITGGLRELSEESLGIFGKITIEEIKNCLAVYDENNLIIFIPIHVDIFNKYNEFSYRVAQIKNPEVSDLTILDKKQFLALINGKSIHGTIMYEKVRNLLSGTRMVNNFIRYL